MILIFEISSVNIICIDIWFLNEMPNLTREMLVAEEKIRLSQHSTISKYWSCEQYRFGIQDIFELLCSDLCDPSIQYPWIEQYLVFVLMFEFT